MPDVSRDPALPPLEWLRVFEAAARRGNFTAAAGELGLTQAAVSQRIRNLEAHLGAPLFRRLPRGVELTVDGEAYAPHVRSALAAIRRSTADLFSAPRRQLSVAASASVIGHWLVPRLPRLMAAMPDLQIATTTVHRAADLDSAGTDIEIRFGNGAWPGREARKLFDEVLAPVAAPSLVRDTADWRALPQIAVAGPRAGWLDWAAATGAAPPRSPLLRFDTFSQGLGAAAAGVGVLLGSIGLIGAALAAGTLIRLPEPAMRMDDGYWLCWRSRDAATRDHAAILETLFDDR